MTNNMMFISAKSRSPLQHLSFLPVLIYCTGCSRAASLLRRCHPLANESISRRRHVQTSRHRLSTSVSSSDLDNDPQWCSKLAFTSSMESCRESRFERRSREKTIRSRSGALEREDGGPLVKAVGTVPAFIGLGRERDRGGRIDARILRAQNVRYEGGIVSSSLRAPTVQGIVADHSQTYHSSRPTPSAPFNAARAPDAAPNQHAHFIAQ